jgi:hypothetical protein
VHPHQGIAFTGIQPDINRWIPAVVAFKIERVGVARRIAKRFAGAVIVAAGSCDK